MKKPKKQHEEPPAKVEGYNVAFVGNIPWEINQQALEELLHSLKPKFIRMFDDPVTKKHRGFAHVHFADSASLDRYCHLRNPQNDRCISVAASLMCAK